MGLIKHIFKKHLPATLVIVLALLVIPAILLNNGTITPDTGELAIVEIKKEEPPASITVAPEDIFENPPLFDIEIEPVALSMKSREKKIPTAFFIGAVFLFVIVVVCTSILFKSKKRQKMKSR